MRLRGRGEEGRRRGRAWTATASAAPTTPTPAAGAGSLGSASGDKAHLLSRVHLLCVLFHCLAHQISPRFRLMSPFRSIPPRRAFGAISPLAILN